MQRIRVDYEQDEDTWVATSAQIPRWTAVARSLADLHQLVEDGVRFALKYDADERGEPFVDEVEVVHLVPASA